MKSILVMCTIALTAISCSKRIDLTGRYDPTQSFEVYLHPVGTTEFRVGDARHTKLVSWLEVNNKNWKPTKDDWGSMILIDQEKFNLMLFLGDKFAVVTIEDDENVSRCYSKKCNNDGAHILEK